MNNNFFMQVIKFGFVGGFAAFINFIALIIIVNLFNINPLFANIFAFLIAFQISFFGHHFLSFKTHKLLKKRNILHKFFLVAIFSFVLNQGFFAFFLVFISNYKLAFILTLIVVPPITFILSKFWAFKIKT